MLDLDLVLTKDLVDSFVDDLMLNVESPERLGVNEYYEPEPDGVLHAITAAANCYHYEIGSGRVAVIFKDEGFVIKVPYNMGGVQQNQEELARCGEDETTDVIDSRILFGYEAFILVNPYYQPVMERFDELIASVLNTHSDAKRLDDVVSYEMLDEISENLSEVDFDILDYAVGLVADNEHRLLDHDGTDDCALVTEFWELVDEHAFGTHLANNFSGWVDLNAQNFGITESEQYILLDAGLTSEHQLHMIFSDVGSESLLMSDLCVL